MSKLKPLSERIADLGAEAEAIVDAKAAELKRQFAALPLPALRRDLENKAPGCACKQALAILNDAARQVSKEGSK